MSNNNWFYDLDILSEVNALRNSGYKWEEIFLRLVSKYPEYNFGNVPDSVRKRFSEHKQTLLYAGKPMNQEISFYTYDEAYKMLCDFIGKKKQIKQPKIKNKKRRKILSMSDPHIPFHNIEIMRRIVQEHNDADVLVIAGDYFDCYSVSRFSKEKIIPLKEEIVQGTAVLDWLAGIFPQIIILEGNHSDRVRKYFESRVSPDLMFLVQYNILDLISKNYKNVEVVNDYYTFDNGNGDAEIGHFKVVGKDCLFGHFERSSIIPIRATQYSYNWIKSWGKHFKIDNIRLFLQGHTHRLSKYPIDEGAVTIGETGTVAQIQGYAIGPGAKYSAHMNGYWVVYQDDEVTDVNASNFYIC